MEPNVSAVAFAYLADMHGRINEAAPELLRVAAEFQGSDDIARALHELATTVSHAADRLQAIEQSVQADEKQRRA
jgi:hypothetical protein